MSKRVLAGLVAVSLLFACPAFAGAKVATHVTHKSIGQAKAKAVSIFTRSTLGYQLTKKTKTSLLFSKTFAKTFIPEEFRGEVRGRPMVQVLLDFKPKAGNTLVTGDVWLMLSPREKNKRKHDLTETGTMPQLKKLMAEIR